MAKYTPRIVKGKVVSYEPLIYVTLFGAKRRVTKHCKLDTGACRTLFSAADAETCGIDLTDSREIRLTAANRTPIDAFIAKVKVSLGNEDVQYVMDTEICFSKVDIPRPLIGHRGFLQYFNVCFHGERLCVFMDVNRSFTGSIRER